ncbi:Alpha/Beta hydrolase protein [Aspergillus avenaceus]|uniref:Carboxylic ester hydrolase n=1 Tax=Aspergillus avenaceus TaxID=36643 RepID=A0A5N6TV70_ASPAV|nr:Alpha/Beta hydrolase protein [Aspergillus avenaceus]
MLKTIVCLSTLWVAVHAAPSGIPGPVAHVRNGTYVGVRNDHYKQDFFLGMSYAQQPTGDLRFTVPQSLNRSWDGMRDAKEYSEICVGYGTDSIWYPMSEACLTLNVVRGSSADENSNLPVGVWIHGGGFYMGSGSDQRYNMSAIVDNSYKIGKPFIAVSLNYRVSAWGFLGSSEVTDSGNTNLGIRDQRLALQWIKENIQAFGGDPDKITIWGESAGAISVGLHLTAYGGRDDGLFRGAIMESGGSISARPMNSTGYQAMYDDVVAKVNCTGSEDTLQCLREVPFEDLNAVFNGTDGDPVYQFWPAVDNDLVTGPGSVQLDNHEFIKVPILAGTNTDEGVSFGPTGINTTEQFYAYLTDGSSGFKLPPAVANQILDLYPDDPSQGIPGFLGDQRVPSKGYQWRRTSAYGGDYAMHANRRRQCEAWAAATTTAYCYRFNMRGADVPYLSGADHFEEVAFVFNNIAGLGYHYGKPFEGMPESYHQLSTLMASMWASFIHDLDPNSGIKDEVRWQAYGDQPVDLVFDANVTSYMEPDTWRKEGIDYINSNARVYWR